MQPITPVNVVFYAQDTEAQRKEWLELYVALRDGLVFLHENKQLRALYVDLKDRDGKLLIFATCEEIQ